MRLKIDNVSKKYKNDFWGLKDFNLDLRPGVLGLLGPNGAGKSTLMRIIATITKPTDGIITWNGEDIGKNPNSLRPVLGYLPQDFGIYPNINAVEFLEYMAAVKGLNAKQARRRIDELLQLVNLHDSRKKLLGTYSGGMKQRVGIAQALLNDPELIIVDEPTVGLDPEERVRFRNLLSDLSGERIVIFSTHIVSDIEATATSLAIISQGRLLEHAEPETLLKSIEGQVWESIIQSEKLAEVRQKYVLSGTTRRSDGIHIRVLSEMKPFVDAQTTTPSLEDAYLYYISKSREVG